MKKFKPSTIGLLQALGVAAYCYLISGFFQLMEKIAIQPPVFAVAGFMLIILVFSVAVVGSLIFGYAAILALDKRIKEALFAVGYTLLYLLGIGLVILIILII